MIDWLIDWFIEWMNEWMNDWLIDWLIDWLVDWLIWYGKIPLLRPLEIKTTPLVRPAFVRPIFLFLITVNVLKFRKPMFLKKIAYTNSVDADQTAPSGAVW